MVSSNLLGAQATTRVDAEIRRADVEVEALLRLHPEATLVLKMDVEGAEYEIIDCLREARLLDRVGVLMMEWHRLEPSHDPHRLVEAMHEAGLRVSESGRSDARFGYLFASR